MPDRTDPGPVDGHRFNPAAMPLPTQCDRDAACGGVAFEPQPGAVLDMAACTLDSGNYFRVLALPADSSGPPLCGHVSVSWLLDEQDAPLVNEGIFRSGIAPVPEP
ncbi:hypothetical protein [Dokdonella sp.]|uniref:hypothetical protein n=1 Tax=Dokdonella sp. TaxID=2291710 RepID=UPI0027BA89D1|nr:hypothetical protein [Dokdonella sp.]